MAPNVSSLILVVGTLYLGGNALLYTSSSFLGVISSEYPDWGTILNTSSAQNIVSAAWLVVVHLVGLGNAPGATGRPAHSARGIDPGQRQTAQCNRLQSAVNHSRTARRPPLHANVKNTCTNRRRVDAIESESKQLEAAAADRGHGTARGDRAGDPGLARGADPGSDLGSSGILMAPDHDLPAATEWCSMSLPHVEATGSNTRFPVTARTELASPCSASDEIRVALIPRCARSHLGLCAALQRRRRRSPRAHE